MTNIRLSDLHQWVAWKYVPRPNGTTGKMPISPHTVQPADKTDPAHWGTLAEARQRAQRDYLDGVGICLTTADPFLCIDLDNAIVDGKPSPLVVELMGRFETYTEYSPSKTGLHIWLKSDDQVNRNLKKQAGIEIYSYSCFLTWTGQRYPSTPNHIAMGSVGWLVERYTKPTVRQTQVMAQLYNEPTADDAALWDRIFRFDRTQRLRRLFNGDLSVAGNDHSLGVIVVLNALARYTRGDRQRMRRMITQTALPSNKWATGRGDGDWLEWRISDAVAYVGA